MAIYKLLSYKIECAENLLFSTLYDTYCCIEIMYVAYLTYLSYVSI